MEFGEWVWGWIIEILDNRGLDNRGSANIKIYCNFCTGKMTGEEVLDTKVKEESQKLIKNLQTQIKGELKDIKLKTEYLWLSLLLLHITIIHFHWCTFLGVQTWADYSFLNFYRRTWSNRSGVKWDFLKQNLKVTRPSQRLQNIPSVRYRTVGPYNFVKLISLHSEKEFNFARVNLLEVQLYKHI